MHARFWRTLVCLGLSAVTTPVVAETWTGFRGQGNSVATSDSLPWDVSTRGRAGGHWTVRLPGYGQSSPVVWDQTVFVTSVSGENKEHLHLLAVSLRDGSILWQKDASGTQRVPDRDTVSRGAPTPVVDAEQVYAVFESGDVLAATHAGEVVWTRSFVKDYGEIQGPHGYSSSPVLVDDLLILQVAHSGPSYILALDRKTGANRWKVDHPSQTGWSSPVVHRVGDQAQVIVSTSGSVRALDAATGKELWAMSDISGNSTASPTISGNYVLIGAGGERGAGGGRRPGGERAGGERAGGGERPTGGERAGGERPSGRPSGRPAGEPAAEGRGDEAPQRTAAGPPGSALLRLSPTEGEAERVVWRAAAVTTGYSSPVILGDYAYFVNRTGVAQCVELATGAVQWQHRLPGEVWASPVANNGHITFFGKFGAVVTLKGGPELVEVAESQLSATDVVCGVAATSDSWLIRTGRSLIRVGQPDSGAAPATGASE